MSARQTAITIAEDAVKLLRSGRVSVALGNSERLPSLISAAIAEAYEAGVTDGLPPSADPAVLQAQIEARQAVVQRLDAEIGDRQVEVYRLGAEAHSLRAEIARLEALAQHWQDTIARLERQEARVAERIKLKSAMLVRPPGPATPKPAQRLAVAITEGRITVERAAEVLRIRSEDVLAIAAGKVSLGGGAWRKLLQEIAA